MVFNVNVEHFNLIRSTNPFPLSRNFSMFIIALFPGPFRCQRERLGMGLGMRLYNNSKWRHFQGKEFKGNDSVLSES